MDKDEGSKDTTGSKDAGNSSKNDGEDEPKARKVRRERREDPDEKSNQSAGNEAMPTGDGPAGRPRRQRGTDAEKEKETNAAGGGGGWMSSPDKRDKASKLSIEDDEPREAMSNPMNKDKFFQENTDDIMIIPDLDEDGYDGDQRVAHAPRNVNRKIPTLSDLENEVKAAIPSAEGGFDLGILLRTLVPAALVQEVDSTWTFESLLRDVTDELTAPTKTVLEPTTGATDPSTPSGKDGTTKAKTKAALDKLKGK